MESSFSGHGIHKDRGVHNTAETVKIVPNRTVKTSIDACNELMAKSLILSYCCYISCIRRKLRKMLNITGTVKVDRPVSAPSHLRTSFSFKSKLPVHRSSPSSLGGATKDNASVSRRVRVAVRFRPQNVEESVVDTDFADSVELQPELKRSFFDFIRRQEFWFVWSQKVGTPQTQDSRFIMLLQVEIKAGDDVRLDLRGHRVRSLNSSGLNLSPNLEVIHVCAWKILVYLLIFPRTRKSFLVWRVGKLERLHLGTTLKGTLYNGYVFPR
ncbi:unnamed protein product [Camellia sinensis]